MQVNDLKLKNRRKSRKIVGRGGKSGTYCGRGNKGQKSRSGGNVDPLFEGGRSTLIDHMKKKRGFKSRNDKMVLISLEQLEKNFKNGDLVNTESLIKAKLIGKVNKKDKVKILTGKSAGKFSKKLSIDNNILFSSPVEKIISKAGGKIIADSEKTVSEKKPKVSKEKK